MCARIIWARLQEDLCIMQHINGKLVFTSAAVFFPMRWFFMDKIGREMDGIHSPVPFYQEDLKRPVDNFMSKGLKVGRPFERSNWMVTDDPELRQVCSHRNLSDFIRPFMKCNLASQSPQATAENCHEAKDRRGGGGVCGVCVRATPGHAKGRD